MLSKIFAVLPTPGQVLKLAVGLVIVFAAAELLGVGSYILAPISSWKNRAAA